MLLSSTSQGSQSDSPWVPPCQDPFRVHRCRDLEGHWEGLLGEYVTAPSVLPWWQQEECIKELCLELAQHMARACLQSRPGSARPTSQRRDAPTDDPGLLQLSLRGQRWPNIPQETLQSGNQNQGGNVPTPVVRTICKGTRVLCLKLQAGASLLLPVPHNHILLMSGSAASLGISTCTQGHENPGIGCGEVMPHTYTRVSSSAGTDREEHPQRPEEEVGQVQHGRKFGQWSYPANGTDHFQVRGTAQEWDNAPSPSNPLSVDPPLLPHSEGPQHYPTHMGGACPKVPATAQPWSQSWFKGMPDLMNHPSQWILEEMDRARAHPHWWKEIRTSKRFTMGSGPRIHTVWEKLSKQEALHYAQWQAVAFRLPLDQQKASGWWDVPPWLCGLCP